MEKLSRLNITTKIIWAVVLSTALSLASALVGNYFLMAVSTFLCLTIASLTAAGIRKEINALRKNAEIISDGNYDIPFDESSITEIGRLSASMSRMANHFRDDSAVSHSIQTSIESPLFTADKDTVLTFLNKSACELMDVVPEEVVGKKTTKELFGSDKATRSALAGHSMSAYEVNIRNRRGESIPVIASSGPLRKSNGEIVGSFLTFIDLRQSITKQREYLEQQVKPIEQAVLAVAGGDLTASVHISEDNQLYELGMQVQKMITGLSSTLGQVFEASNSVTSAASQISSSTEELAAGSQEQSAHGSEVAAAVEEMTKTVIESSGNAANAAEVARTSGRAAKEGGAVVEQTVKKIREIADVIQNSASTVEQLGSSTDQIGEIVSVIDDIANQTNLLALNAAIEAARAGEEGRGFAVVADEVRNLAERTTQATKQIASMIRSLQAEATEAVKSMRLGSEVVTEGIKLADKAGESLKAIVENTECSVDMITQIAAASEEQSSTSEEISKNVESISTVSIQSAAGISQIAKAADDLSGLTESLRNLVHRFKLDREPAEPMLPFGSQAAVSGSSSAFRSERVREDRRL
ncbi:MAG: methyl-accepting chemotaxis protein [Bacteroidetes bacterium]|nr:methyl-accepting chemotaxis protein [Bacteroidota bacterium]